MHNGLLSSGPDPFGQNLTQSARHGAGVAQRCPGRLWKYGTESESRKLSAGSGPVASCQKPGQPDESRAALTPAYFQTDAFGQILTRTSGRSDLGGSVLHNAIHVFVGKTELKRMRKSDSGIYRPTGYPARFWLHAGRNGRNQNVFESDPVCLRDWVTT